MRIKQRARVGSTITVGLLSTILCQTLSSQDGLSLIHKMQQALGGADKIAAIRDFEQTVRAESWNGNTGRPHGEVRKRTRWVRPG